MSSWYPKPNPKEQPKHESVTQNKKTKNLLVLAGSVSPETRPRTPETLHPAGWHLLRKSPVTYLSHGQNSGPFPVTRELEVYGSMGSEDGVDEH